MSQVIVFNYSQDINPLDGIQALITKSGFEEMIPDGGSVCVDLYGRVRLVVASSRDQPPQVRARHPGGNAAGAGLSGAKDVHPTDRGEKRGRGSACALRIGRSGGQRGERYAGELVAVLRRCRRSVGDSGVRTAAESRCIGALGLF